MTLYHSHKIKDRTYFILDTDTFFSIQENETDHYFWLTIDTNNLVPQQLSTEIRHGKLILSYPNESAMHSGLTKAHERQLIFPYILPYYLDVMNCEKRYEKNQITVVFSKKHSNIPAHYYF
jgi:hypothetical protein